MKIKIYTGLSLNQSSGKEVLPIADWQKPVCRGDLLKDIQEGYQIIGLIDGEFSQNLAVSPSEIMDALRCGLTVFGSSSMGALRAAELDDYGMIGVGEIYKFIKKAEPFKDDYLGQIFYEGSQVVIMPFIDFFFATKNLVNRQKLNKKIADQLIDLYASLHFSERNFLSLKSLVQRKSFKNKESLIHAIALIEKKGIRQKKEDAMELIKSVRAHLAKIEKIQARLNGFN